MTILELDGLIGSHPLGAMAAFGLLRVLNQSGHPAARLHFVERDDWVARIESDLPSVDSLIDELRAWVATPRERVLAWTGESDLRVEPQAFHRALSDALGGDDTEDLAFLSSLAAYGAVDKSKGLIKPTSFYMASGQQSFVDAMRRVLRHVRAHPDSWTEALLGPWKYSASMWGAGWDPGSERMHALRHQAPTKDKPGCVAAAVWLAFESLPAFPTLSLGGRERTVGFQYKGGRRWRWPVPSSPISFDTLSVLVGSRLVQVDAKQRVRCARPGIGAVYEAVRHEFGQGYGVFRPSVRVA